MQIKKSDIKTFDAAHMKVGVVVANFNEEITGKLLKSAMDALAKCNIGKKNIRVVVVPGSVEIPFVLQKFAQSKKYDCLVALGAVIKGETDHYTYVCKIVQEGALRVMLDYSIPVGFGVLTANTLEQAKARTDFGGHAAAAALELASLKF